jgi:hypothetical protein
VARRAVLHPAQVHRRRGVPVTTPAVTALRLGAALPRDSAVAAVDRLIATRVVDLEPIRPSPPSRAARARPVRAR